jgi:hypothetical protein
MLKWKRWIVTTALLSLGATPTLASVFGNPATPVGEGRFGIGVALSSTDRSYEYDNSETDTADVDRITFLGAYGLSSSAAVEFYLGRLEIDKLTGTEFGAGYRMNTGRMGKLESGFMARVLAANLSDDPVDATVLHIEGAFGVGYPIENVGSVYGAGVVSKATGTLSADGSDDIPIEEDSFLGGVIGFEFAPKNMGLQAGVELHLLNENGFGVYFLKSF